MIIYYCEYPEITLIHDVTGRIVLDFMYHRSIGEINEDIVFDATIYVGI